MENIKKYIYLAAVLIFLGLLAYLSLVKTQRDNARTNLDLANKQVQQLQTYIQKTNQQLKAVQQLDKEYQEKLANAQANNDKLLNDLNNANKRLFVKVKCPALPSNPATTSGVNATTRAELDRENAARIIRITQDGDNAIMQLSALQKYVRNVCLKN